MMGTLMGKGSGMAVEYEMRLGLQDGGRE
jgi:hypothetical protein